jgi:hypothetical protein
MVTGILLVASQCEKGLTHPGSDLGTIPAVALCCSSAVYLLAFVALRWRVSHDFGVGRPVAALVSALLTTLLCSCRASLRWGLVAVVWLGLHGYELVRWSDERARRRSLGA